MITDKEYKQLATLGKKIIIDLSENFNCDGVPGRTCRFEAIKNMINYLEIHDYNIS